MIIPYQELSADALTGICREYVLQQLDGQYDPDFEMGSALQVVESKVRKGELLVNFSEANESVTLSSKEELAEMGYQPE